MPSLSLPRSLALTSALALACCTPPPPQPLPPPVVQPSPTPTQAPPPVVQQPVYDNWLDAPQTPGDWSYSSGGRSSVARFSQAGADKFVLFCDLGTRKVGLVRVPDVPGSAPRVMGVRTETTMRLLQASPIGGAGQLQVDLAATDPILDAMALSRGRFAIEMQGEQTLYLPSWAEVTRVIEDCR